VLDEEAYQAARDELARLPCPFEKSVLSRCGGCELALTLNVAEREAVACKSAPARENCLTLHGLLHQNAAFALHLAHPGEPLPHAKEMKIQCGGLLGAQRLIWPEAEVVDNIHGLVGHLQARYGRMDALPYAAVVKAIAAHEGRRRR